ncbi:LacI family DNA-binding transcriptional regulator [Microbacterium sp. YY-01]
MLDVARAADVSRATVSLVMTNSPLVADHTREKVLKAAQELGYVYNRNAASFRTQRSYIIGLVVSDLRNPFFGEIAATVQQFLSEQGYFVVVVNTLDNLEQQEHALTRLLESRADGVLLVPCPGSDVARIREVNELMPVVLLTRELDAPEVSYVGSMDYDGGAAAARHLIEVHECRRLGFFGNTAPGSAGEKRFNGFRDTVEAAGGTLEPIWQGNHIELTSQSYRAFRTLLETSAPPEGLVCNSDNVAYGALRALRDSGFMQISDCRVIGFDDVEQSALWSPSLTSVSVSRADLGVSAAQTVLAAIRGELKQPVVLRHQSQLQVRESCGCAMAGEIA